MVSDARRETRRWTVIARVATTRRVLALNRHTSVVVPARVDFCTTRQAGRSAVRVASVELERVPRTTSVPALLARTRRTIAVPRTARADTIRTDGFAAAVGAAAVGVTTAGVTTAGLAGGVDGVTGAEAVEAADVPEALVAVALKV